MRIVSVLVVLIVYSPYFGKHKYKQVYMETPCSLSHTQGARVRVHVCKTPLTAFEHPTRFL
jgi:hypothetical protein